MATRATYSVNGTTFYCHWDGYPTGAAQRFANMVKALTVAAEPDNFDEIQDRRGGFEYAFIRGNLDAEPTESHDAHGDTEFRYICRGSDEGAWIEVQSVGWEGKGFERQIIRTIYAGPLAAWLNQQREELTKEVRKHYADRIKDPEAYALEQIPIIVEVREKHDYNPRENVTLATLKAASTIASGLRAHSEKFKPDNPNKVGYAKRADAWDAACNIIDKAA